MEQQQSRVVRITGYGSNICWWMGCLNQICPVLEVYEPTGYIKIRAMRTEVHFEDQSFPIEGYIPSQFVEYVEGGPHEYELR